jgi:hypothetical protein
MSKCQVPNFKDTRWHVTLNAVKGDIVSDFKNSQRCLFYCNDLKMDSVMQSKSAKYVANFCFHRNRCL